MKITLTIEEIHDIHRWVVNNPMDFENAPANKKGLSPDEIQYKKKVESFFGRCGELAVQKAFGGNFIKEGNGSYGGDWYINPNKVWDVKTQDTLHRTYNKLSIDLTKKQLQRYQENNIHGIIFCTAEFDLKRFIKIPTINIVAYAYLKHFPLSPAKGSGHSIDYSIYEDSWMFKTDFSTEEIFL